MDEFPFEIDGFDIRFLIAEKGIRWTAYNANGDNGGMSKAGTEIIDRLARKRKCVITCRDMSVQEARLLLPRIEPLYVTLRYYDLALGVVSKVMYSNNADALVNCIYSDGEALIQGVSFPLVMM